MVSSNKGPTNPAVVSLIYQLRKASNTHEAPIWRAISKKLQKPRRQRSEVNISKISRYSKNKETVLIPGKVLGAGEIDFPVTVVALAVSEGARAKIKAAKGKVMTIPELLKKNPKGKGVRILG